MNGDRIKILLSMDADISRLEATGPQFQWRSVGSQVGPRTMASEGHHRVKRPNPRIGSSLQQLLRDGGILEEARAVAIKEAIAFQVQKTMRVTAARRAGVRNVEASNRKSVSRGIRIEEALYRRIETAAKDSGFHNPNAFIRAAVERQPAGRGWRAKRRFFVIRPL